MASSSENISLCKILSESRNKIRANLNHFQALAVLFCFPLSLCLIINPTIQTTIFSQFLSTFTYFTENPVLYLLFNHLHTISVCLFILCSVAIISHSIYRALSDEPLVFIESKKSIFHSFWPIIYTQLISGSVVTLISIPSFLLAILGYKCLRSYGVEDISNLNSYFLIFIIFISLMYIVLVTYFQVNWMLAYMVAVVESKWGYEALKRSVYLNKGNRAVALSMLFYIGLTSGGICWCLYVTYWWSWGALFYLIFASIYLSFILLGQMVASGALYVYCRDLHKGLPFKNANNCPPLN